MHVQQDWDLLKMIRREATVYYLLLSLHCQQFKHLVISMAPKDSFLRLKVSCEGTGNFWSIMQTAYFQILSLCQIHSAQRMSVKE